MAWETEQLHRTLLIEVHPGGDGRKRYAVNPLCRVTTQVGQTYLEPLRAMFDRDTAVVDPRDAWFFDNVEFINPPGVDRKDTRGDIGLTNFGNVSLKQGL